MSHKHNERMNHIHIPYIELTIVFMMTCFPNMVVVNKNLLNSLYFRNSVSIISNYPIKPSATTQFEKKKYIFLHDIICIIILTIFFFVLFFISFIFIDDQRVTWIRLLNVVEYPFQHRNQVI